MRETQRFCYTRILYNVCRMRWLEERKRRIKTGRRCAHLLRVYEAYVEQNERTVTFLFRDREDLPTSRYSREVNGELLLGELFRIDFRVTCNTV